ncbi:anoctamin-9-like [Neolamprologus brichardi]|uniref:anoctamin-9-like n=1 Tax=Neolamprologus brichardi TaxID=32507 RepID=UPI001643B7E8|nr:anoctamin-9-like [Neolamprologus brichardi]
MIVTGLTESLTSVYPVSLSSFAVVLPTKPLHPTSTGRSLIFQPLSSASAANLAYRSFLRSNASSIASSHGTISSMTKGRAFCLFSRIRIVHFILHHTHINTGENLEELLMKDVFETMFCLHEVTHLFDNEGTVAFAMFMAIWATLFLELWKRHRAKHVSKWKVYDWCEEEEELIMELVNDPNCKAKQFRHSYLRSTLVLILLMLIIGLAHALVVFRVVAAPLMSESEWEFLKDNANLVSVFLGAVLHYITIQIMTRVRIPGSSSLSVGRMNRKSTINGHPGNYVRLAGFRLEECHPSGCLTDLFIQMAVIMLLKQTLNNIVEFTVPWCKRLVSEKAAKKLERKCGYCYRKACREENGCIEPCDICKHREWLRNYHLASTDAFSLFNEFLEMAPLLALINNIFEIRLDAIKMVRLEQRLVPKKTNDIGVWTKLLEAIGVLAVIANGLVIGITSDFIPRLVYRYHYGPCAKGKLDYIDCMEGYIKDTLSTAYMNSSNFDAFINPWERHNFSVTECSYRDYRNENDYSLKSQFWMVLAVRFAFIILFEHVLVMCKFIAAWFVPDNPTQVKNERLQDKLTRLKHELREKKLSKSTDV